MAQYQIIVNQELLHRLFLNDHKDSSVSALLESVLNQILQAQVSEQLEAEPYERTGERKGYRNGNYPHSLTTRVGTITLRISRVRNGRFSTEIFARYQRSEQALVLALMEMVVNGVSTRKISQITEELCGTASSIKPFEQQFHCLIPVSGHQRPVICDTIVPVMTYKFRFDFLEQLVYGSSAVCPYPLFHPTDSGLVFFPAGLAFYSEFAVLALAAVMGKTKKVELAATRETLSFPGNGIWLLHQLPAALFPLSS